MRDNSYELAMLSGCLLIIAVAWFALLWRWFKVKPPEDLVARRHREIARNGFKSRLGAK